MKKLILLLAALAALCCLAGCSLLSGAPTEGEAPVGISSISKTGSEENVDTYTIVYTDNTTSSFTVTNGRDGADGTNGINGKDGVSITNAQINEAGELELTFSNGEPLNLGKVVGEKGKDGKDGEDNPNVNSITGVEITAQGELIVSFSNAEPLNVGAVVGKDGEDGVSVTGAQVNTAGELVLTFSKGEPLNLGKVVGATGPKGDPGKDGANGKTVEFRVNGIWMQWKYTSEGESAWKNLYETNGTPAPVDLVKISFTMNGGAMPTGTPTEIDVTSGTTITLPTPTKRGYTFMGWFLTESDEYAVSNPFRAHQSERLYAVWEAGAIITGTKIYNLNDLMKIKNNLSGTYVLMNDIDCGGLAISVIGTDSTSSFRGIFEGQGYTISNYKASTGTYVGLFGYSTGTIRNLQVKAFNLTMENQANSGDIFVGGIVGYNAGTIQKCSATQGNISIKINNPRNGGLIAGCNSGVIENCFATGNVIIDQAGQNQNWACAGGIAASNNGMIRNCYADVYTYAYGYYKSYVQNDSCGESAAISAHNNSSGTIENCFVLGRIESNNRKGDICTRNDGKITNCYKDVNMSITDATHTYATAMTKTEMSSDFFYTVSLEWDDSVWNFYNLDLENGIYPTLVYNF